MEVIVLNPVLSFDNNENLKRLPKSGDSRETPTFQSKSSF